MEKGRTVHDLHKESLAYVLYEGIRSGKKQTVADWADEFDVFPVDINSALTKLRKLGCHIHPVKTVIGIGKRSKKGVLVDIMKNKDDFSEVYSRIKLMRLDPGIKDFFRKTEVGLKEFPTLRESLVQNFNGFLNSFSFIHKLFGLWKTPNTEFEQEIEEAYRRK